MKLAVIIASRSALYKGELHTLHSVPKYKANWDGSLVSIDKITLEHTDIRMIFQHQDVTLMKLFKYTIQEDLDSFILRQSRALNPLWLL